MVRLAGRLAERSLGGKVYFANSGAEANEAAIKLARKRRPRRALRGAPRRLPRAHLRRAVGDAAGGQAGALRPARPGLRRRAAAPRRRTRSTADTAGVMLELVQGETGVHPLPPSWCRDPRRLRRARRAADPRRGPDRDGAHRHAVGLRALRRPPDVITRRQGPRRGLPIGALIAAPEYARRVRARRPRLDLRRQPAVARRRQRRARRDRRPGVARAVRERGEQLAEGLRELPGVAASAARPDGGRRGRRRRAGARAPRAHRAARWSSTPPARARCASSRRSWSPRRRSTRRSGACPRCSVDDVAARRAACPRRARGACRAARRRACDATFSGAMSEMSCVRAERAASAHADRRARRLGGVAVAPGVARQQPADLEPRPAVRAATARRGPISAPSRSTAHRP